MRAAISATLAATVGSRAISACGCVLRHSAGHVLPCGLPQAPFPARAFVWRSRRLRPQALPRALPVALPRVWLFLPVAAPALPFLARALPTWPFAVRHGLRFDPILFGFGRGCEPPVEAICFRVLHMFLAHFGAIQGLRQTRAAWMFDHPCDFAGSRPCGRLTHGIGRRNRKARFETRIEE